VVIWVKVTWIFPLAILTSGLCPVVTFDLWPEVTWTFSLGVRLTPYRAVEGRGRAASIVSTCSPLMETF
jgi:hypothetical protein